MARRLAIIGAGGHGRVVADCAEANGWDEIRLFDDNPNPAGTPWPLSGGTASLLEQVSRFDGVIVGIGANAVRLALTHELLALGAPLATIIHPRAMVSPHARIGPGSVVCAGAVVNTGATLGLAVIANTGATVDHDCTLDEAVHVSPGAHLAGGVVVGRESWIGIGAVVREAVTIGRQVCVGAGSVVVKSVPDGLTVVGNPARLLQR